MEFGVDRFGLKNGNRMIADVIIEGVADPIAIGFLFDVDMRHLAQGVNAGIGAPGNEHLGFFATKSRDRFLNHLLNPKTVFLALPADKVAAVIFEGEFVALHHSSFDPGGRSKPRRNSSPDMGFFPARCTLINVKDPSPQATRKPSATLPGSLRPDCS